MGSPLPEDPYVALGVAKDATATAIKTQYRKLVLKCHPDKVQDEAKKAAAVDNFHKIQTAYEIIGDEDRRARYDAQVRLAQLKKDVMNRQGADAGRTAEVRATTTRMPTEASRNSAYFARGQERTSKVSPQYEERKPAYATQYSPTDYFDSAPRPTPQRKDSEYERSSKRPAATRRESERVKVSSRDAKENERTRQKERSRQTEREIKRSRERKQSHAEVEEDSDSDEQEIWQRRKMREEDLRRAYQQEAQAQTQTHDARRTYYDSGERAKKVMSQYDAAREHIDSRKRRQDSERRPSPVRRGSSKEKNTTKKSEKEKPGLFFRWGSGKPKAAARDSSERTTERRAEREAAREEQRRSSADEVEGYRRGTTTVEELRRPPNLQHSKSSPAGIQIPDETNVRAQSVQVEPQEAAAIPRFRRAETMPNVPGREKDVRRREALPRQASGLRQTEVVDGLATPAATPETPEVKPPKYNYRREYADDYEYATPDGYRTEERIPERAPQAVPTKAQRYTRSPSPMRGTERLGERERERERATTRAASARYAQTSPQRPAPMPRTTSTSYVYKNGATAEARPTYSRENSGRMDEKLYGEVLPRTRSTRSPRHDSGRQAPPEPEYRESTRYRPEDVRMASGYSTSSRRASMAGRSYSRTNSGNPVYVRA